MFNKYVGFCRLDVGHEAEFGPDLKKVEDREDVDLVNLMIIPWKNTLVK